MLKLENEYIKPADLVIYFFIVGFCLLLIIYPQETVNTSAMVNIYYDGKIIYVDKIDNDVIKKFYHNGVHLTVEIKEGKVRMVDSDCKGQLCIKQGNISKQGEMIICIPGKTAVKIEGINSLDAILR